MEKTGIILLVEDNKDDELLTLDALHSAKVSNPIQVVRDGQEALDFLFCEGEFASRKPNGICLVLLDLKLPKITGSEVLRKIKQDARTNRMPVVVLTTSSEQEDIARSYGNGANSYVRKPVDFEKFQESVRQLGLYWTVINERYY